jgi:hypothetical protein
MRRRHVVATTHKMAAVPDAFANYTGSRLGVDRRECRNERREQNERYKFAHGSILEQNRIVSGVERHACLVCLCGHKGWPTRKLRRCLNLVTQKQTKKKGYTPKRVTL